MACNECTVPLDVMFDRGVRVAMIYLRDGFVFFDDGTTVPITTMWDEDGDVVDEWEEAVACEFGSEEVGYGTVVVPFSFYPPRFH